MTNEHYDKVMGWLDRMELLEIERERRGWKRGLPHFFCGCSCGQGRELHSAMVAAQWFHRHVSEGHEPRIEWGGHA